MYPIVPRYLYQMFTRQSASPRRAKPMDTMQGRPRDANEIFIDMWVIRQRIDFEILKIKPCLHRNFDIGLNSVHNLWVPESFRVAVAVLRRPGHFV